MLRGKSGRLIAYAGVGLTLTCFLWSRPATAQQTDEAAAPNRARAYYHFTLAHMYEERGVLFNQPGMLARAIEELRLALENDPGSSYLSGALANLYARTGRWRSALEEAEGAIERNPDELSARRLLAQLYLGILGSNNQTSAPEGLNENAIRTFEDILQRDPTDVASFLVLAQLYRFSGDNAQSEETLKRALAMQPDSSNVSTQLALLYVEVGDYSAAIEILSRLTEDYEDPDLLSTLAYSYQQMRDYPAAADAYSRALQHDPENRAYKRGLGESFLYDKKFGQAVEQFEGLVADDPRDGDSHLRLSQIYRYQHRHDKARESLHTAGELMPGNMEIQYNQVLLEETVGDIAAAIELIRGILESSQKRSTSFYTAQEKTNRAIFLGKLGVLNRGRGEFQAAEAAYREMGELGGDNSPRSQVGLIETFQDARDYERALAVSKQAVEQFPDNRDLILTRAYLLATTGEREAPARLLEPLLNGSSQDREIHLALAQVLLRTRQYDEAIQAVDQAREISEGVDEKWYIEFLYGSISERRKSYGQAESAFRRALDLNPESAMTLNYLGYMLADQGIRLDEAVGYIEKALETDPSSGAYLDSLGWAYYRLDQLEKAEEYLTKALERIPNDPTIRDHLGDLYARTGRMTEALVEWKAALEEWNRLPENELEVDEVSALEQKIRQADTAAKRM
jgi:tetratricopeptide (TPR) repeat protein